MTISTQETGQNALNAERHLIQKITFATAQMNTISGSLKTRQSSNPRDARSASVSSTACLTDSQAQEGIIIAQSVIDSPKYSEQASAPNPVPAALLAFRLRSRL